MSGAPVRIVVIGAGHMGRLHAQKLAALHEAGEGVTLAGVADVERSRAEEVARPLGVAAVARARDLFASADAAIVAVPTIDHYAVVSEALAGGLDVLIEKPIAATLRDAEELLAHAKSAGRVLQVGHLERFNGAMRRVAGLVCRPRFIEAHRLGPFPARATDVDVVRDLMIHDLDLIQGFLHEEPSRVESIGVPVLTRNVDIANARLTFPSGCVANLTASRVSPTPMRKLRLFQPDGYISIDFLAQSAVVFRRFEQPGREEPRIEMEKLEIDREDALLEELRAFAASVRARSTPSVSGEEALSALRTALRVIEAMPPLDALR
ncbi:MAG TPA: Gfo/Idh/MocA family oxidoreductase [Myxococcota bacterium]|nr:Gfo/Idh/MocA family oxidoreductase [Myxococcota bacterium]